MNIRQLKELIKDLPDSLDVIFEPDHEDKIDDNYIYTGQTIWRAQVYYTTRTPQSEYKSYPECLVLYPTKEKYLYKLP